MEVRLVEGYDRLDEVRELFREYTKALGVDLGFQNYEAELKSLPGKYGRPKGGLYLALRGETAVGCAAYRALGESVCELKRLYVRPGCRGLKVGEKLTQLVLKEAFQTGYREVVLDTLESLTAAVSLYRKMGFEETDPYYDNPIEGCIYFRRDLC